MRSVYIAALSLAVMSPQLSAQQQPQPRNGSLPSVSADGSMIAFTANRDGAKSDLYVIRADGTGEQKLVVGSDGTPRWVPGEKRVMYAVGAFSADSTKVVTIDAAGTTTPQAVATIPGRDAAMSPDRKWLVATTGKFPAVTLSILGLDGKPVRALTDGKTPAFNASWSADGKRIAYARFGEDRDMQLWLVNADGTGSRQLTHFIGTDGHPQWPTWSPDGKWIAVQAGNYDRNNPAASSSHIWLVNAETGAATKVGAHEKPYLDETPSFFPDGKRVAFQSDRTGRMEVWVMNIDGTGARQVTR